MFLNTINFSNKLHPQFYNSLKFKKQYSDARNGEGPVTIAGKP
jgi:hypothetical protein